MRHAHVTDVAARASRIDRLDHRLLRADTLQYRIGTDSIGQFPDPGNTLITSLGHDIGSSEFACELLARCMTAHCDDAFSPHLLCGKHSEQPDCAVSHHHDLRARLYVCRIGCKPTRA